MGIVRVLIAALAEYGRKGLFAIQAAYICYAYRCKDLVDLNLAASRAEQQRGLLFAGLPVADAVAEVFVWSLEVRVVELLAVSTCVVFEALLAVLALERLSLSELDRVDQKVTFLAILVRTLHVRVPSLAVCADLLRKNGFLLVLAVVGFLAPGTVVVVEALLAKNAVDQKPHVVEVVEIAVPEQTLAAVWTGHLLVLLVALTAK